LRNLAGEAVATLPGGNGGHGMTVSGTGEVFVAQLSGRVQKFVR
jgi:streptogramin lyase